MDLLNKIEHYVTELFEKNRAEGLYFHDIEHTQELVDTCKLIGKENQLSEAEIEISVFSSWFSDVGYIFSLADPVQKSAELAAEYLRTKDFEPAKIDEVTACILSAQKPHQPKTISEKVFYDAVTHHLSVEDFYERSLLLLKEKNRLSERKIKKGKHIKATLEFLKQHEYTTEYGKKILQRGKEQNIRLLQEKQSELVKKSKTGKKEKTKDTPKNQIKNPYRGVESMFRVTANNQISLSAIADNKANILITVNTITLSVIITFLFSKVNEFPRIIYPTILFLGISLITIVYAILATRPKMSTGTFTKQDIEKRRVNLLFFGNFYNMSLQDYDHAVKEIMLDYDGLYSTLIQDQHALGLVLARKYKLIRNAYNVFMFGLCASVIAFVIAVLPYLD